MLNLHDCVSDNVIPQEDFCFLPSPLYMTLCGACALLLHIGRRGSAGASVALEASEARKTEAIGGRWGL